MLVRARAACTHTPYPISICIRLARRCRPRQGADEVLSACHADGTCQPAPSLHVKELRFCEPSHIADPATRTPGTVFAVTLLGAALTNHEILVAADSLSQSVAIEGREAFVSAEFATKLWRIGSNALVWGFAGEGATGQPFGEWIRDQQPADWGEFAAAAGAALNRINTEENRKVRAYATASGRQGQSVASQVLIAGYIDGVADFIKINNEGNAVRRGSLREMFVGSGAVQAATAWNVAAALLGDDDLRSVETFTQFFRSVVKYTGLLDGDVQVWRVTEGGAVAVSPTPLSEPEQTGG